MRPTRLLPPLLLVLALAACGPAADPLQAGLDAYAAGDHAAALETLRPLANQGNPAALYQLSVMHARGEGVAANPTEAEDWLRRAAEAGHAQAQYQWALVLRARAIEESTNDDQTVLLWLRRAADQDNADALLALGAMHGAGVSGLARDEAASRDYIERAAARGHLRAQYLLGRMHLRGEGVPADPAKARPWL